MSIKRPPLDVLLDSHHRVNNDSLSFHKNWYLITWVIVTSPVCNSLTKTTTWPYMIFMWIITTTTIFLIRIIWKIDKDNIRHSKCSPVYSYTRTYISSEIPCKILGKSWLHTVFVTSNNNKCILNKHWRINEYMEDRAEMCRANWSKNKYSNMLNCKLEEVWTDSHRRSWWLLAAGPRSMACLRVLRIFSIS